MNSSPEMQVFENPTLVDLDLPWRAEDVEEYGPTFGPHSSGQLRQILKTISMSVVGQAHAEQTVIINYHQKQEHELVRICEELLPQPDYIFSYIHKLDKCSTPESNYVHILYITCICSGKLH